MPIYEYQCNHCHHHFDIMQKISDSPISTCPKCSTESLTKLVSAAGFQLKGTGWYASDFKTKSTGGEKSKEPTTQDTSSKTDKGSSE